jgi:O-antigen/teichoic acid export membrane protein
MSPDSRAATAHAGARRTAVDIGLQLLARTANLALGIAVTLILVRSLGEAGFGAWSTIFAIAQIVGYFGDLGLEQIAVRKAAEQPEREGTWVSALLSLRVAIAVPVTLASIGVVALVADDASMFVAGVLVCGTLVVGAFAALRVIFQLRVRNAIPATFELVNGVLWAVVVIAVAAFGGGIVPFAAGFLAVSALVTALQALLALRIVHVPLRGARRHWPELVRVGIPVAISGLLIIAYGRIDQILVFELDGATGAGLYGASYRIVDRAQMVPATIMTTLFPLIAAAWGAHDRDRAKRLVHSAFDLLALGSLPAFAFTLVTSELIVRDLFGPGFEGAGPTLAVMMGTFVLTSIGYLCGYVIIVLSLQRRFVRYAFAGLVVNVTLNVALIPPFGYPAAAWAFLATQVLVIGLSLRAIVQGLGFGVVTGRLARIALASAGMAAVVAGLRAAGAPLEVLAAVAAVVYLLLLIALRAVSRDELALVLRRERP